MTKIPVRFALLILALVLSASAFAKPKTEMITLYHDADLNGTNLPAGDYVVKYDTEGSSAQVTFLKGKKEVATANGQVKALSKKPVTNQVLVKEAGNTRSISEIDFGGKDTAITFDSTAAAAGK